MKVLVVEDSQDDLFLFTSAIRRASHPFLLKFVHDGEQAIAYLKGEPPYDRTGNPLPDLVLLDLGLPYIDGFMVLDWIRSAPTCAHLKVIVWSDWDYPPFVDRAKKAGANFFLSKSVATEDLLEALLGNYDAAHWFEPERFADGWSQNSETPHVW